MVYIPSYIVEKLDALSVYDVAEKLGLMVSRNKALCLMHQDHNPSLHFKKSTNCIHVEDQIVWMAVYGVLGPYFEEDMLAWSYGNRLFLKSQPKCTESQRSRCRVSWQEQAESKGIRYQHHRDCTREWQTKSDNSRKGEGSHCCR